MSGFADHEYRTDRRAFVRNNESCLYSEFHGVVCYAFCRRSSMKLKFASVFCLLICFAFVLPAFAQDPISGTWAGDWGPSKTDRNQVTVQFKFDGKALSGTVNPGDKAVQLMKSTFDP